MTKDSDIYTYLTPKQVAGIGVCFFVEARPAVRRFVYSQNFRLNSAV